MSTPPAQRSRYALGLAAAAALGRFELQVCTECGAVQYPPREACHDCLGIDLVWTGQSGTGELLAITTLHHSNELYFRERLPWRIGLVKLDAGPSVVAHLHGMLTAAPSRVRLTARLDRSGQAVIYALPDIDGANMQNDKQYRETTCSPRARRVLVSEAGSPLGIALVKALAAAGAAKIWAGYGHDRPPEFAGLPQVSPLALDITRPASVAALATEIGHEVDILINSHDQHGGSPDAARHEMEINYFGLQHLAQSFGPALKSRAMECANGPIAWVNLLSIFALSNNPAHSSYSASKAAALSATQALRAELAPAGIRVLNVFPGPQDDIGNRLLPPPKLAASTLANAIVKALEDGVEDLFPGDIAQEWLAKWQENPKMLELELRRSMA